jgi:ribosomal protein L7/L12
MKITRKNTVTITVNLTEPHEVQLAISYLKANSSPLPEYQKVQMIRAYRKYVEIMGGTRPGLKEAKHEVEKVSTSSYEEAINQMVQIGTVSDAEVLKQILRDL